MLEAPLLEEPAREALRQAAAALDLAERRGQPFEMSLALAAVARGYLILSVHATAEAYFELALRWARAAGSTDHTVDLLCSLSETAAQLAGAQDAAAPGSGHAARERARDHAFEASTLAGRVADSGWEVTVLLRISDVLDRFGDRDDAVLLQTRALRLMSGVAPEVVQVASLGRLADG
jgi:hypothetical protein